MFDPNTPSVARTYDYLLGGKDHYPVDREVGEIFIQKFPGAVRIAQDNRACLVRAVTYIVRELGIDQFIDLGSGVWRTDEQIGEYFAGLRLVEPGIVACARWRPDADPGELTTYQRLIAAGLGVK